MNLFILINSFSFRGFKFFIDCILLVCVLSLSVSMVLTKWRHQKLKLNAWLACKNNLFIIVNSNGPMMDHCGTLTIIGNMSGVAFSNSIKCLRLLK